MTSSKLSAGSSFQIVQRNYSTNVQLAQVKSIAWIFLVTEQYTYICSTQLWSAPWLNGSCLIFKSHISSLPHSCTESKVSDVSSLILQDRLQQRLCNSLTKAFKCFIGLFSRSFISWNSALWPTQAEITPISLPWGALQQQPLWGTSKSMWLLRICY